MRKIEALVLANIQSPNVGNGALVTGTLNSISIVNPKNKISPSFYSWDQVTFADSIFRDDFYQKVNESELLLIPGAVTFNGREDHKKGGSRLNFTAQDLDKIRVPIIAHGLSYRFWSDGIYPNKDQLLQTLSYLNSRDDCLIGLRNDGTKAWLENLLGEEMENMPECPDPGFFVCSPRFNDLGKDLFISVNYEDSVNRYKDPKKLERIIQTLVGCCEIFAENINEKIVFVPHSFEDYEMILMVCKRLKVGVLHKKVRVLSMPGFEDHMQIYNHYHGARAVIAMRVHSLSPSLGMRIPTLVISTQNRMKTYMSNLKLEKQIVELNDENISKKCESFLDNVMTERFNFSDQDRAIIGEKNKLSEFYEKAQFI
ncbi:polysaccharide pyruvyl transferase family protein [Actinobacteria bacterium IMCC26103]|nr:polysaccharide pyruvyl transferase family protein [Actinobacteria bacterium IMCC26103]